MTWPSHTCSRPFPSPAAPAGAARLLLFSALLTAAAHAATVSGSIRLLDSKDPKVRKADYSGVVVWLERVGGPPAELRPRHVKIVQRDKRFTPHIVAVPVGSVVDFPNADPIFHNAFSNFSGQAFDTGLYAPGSSQKVRFVHEGVVRVFCNIHPTMSAVIVVAPTPYIAISDRTGQFSIDGVENGQYRMRVFHERSSEFTLQALERRVVVDGAITTTAPVLVSESGYIEVPHKNKYGHDYPPVIEDRATYPPGKNP
jgi:plastocyanin